MRKALTTRRITPDDLPVIARWYEARGEPAPEPWQTGPYGFICEEGGVPVTCGYLILTMSEVPGKPGQFAMYEFLTSNHEAPMRAQSRGMVHITRVIRTISRNLGVKVLMGFVPDDLDSVKRFYEREGARAFKKKMQLYYVEV